MVLAVLPPRAMFQTSALASRYASARAVADRAFVHSGEVIHISSLALLKVYCHLDLSERVLIRDCLDVEAWACGCADGGHGPHAWPICGRVHRPGASLSVSILLFV